MGHLQRSGRHTHRPLHFSILEGTRRVPEHCSTSQMAWTPVTKGNSALLYVGWAMQKICAWKNIFIFFMSTFFFLRLILWGFLVFVFFILFLWWGRVRKAVCALFKKTGSLSQDRGSSHPRGSHAPSPRAPALAAVMLQRNLATLWTLSTTTRLQKKKKTTTHFQKKSLTACSYASLNEQRKPSVASWSMRENVHEDYLHSVKCRGLNV